MASQILRKVQAELLSVLPGGHCAAYANVQWHRAVQAGQTLQG